MKVCYVGAHYDREWKSGREFVDRVYTVREFAREQARLGIDVQVLQHFHRNETFQLDGVDYRFVRPPAMSFAAGNLVGRVRPSTPSSHYQFNPGLARELRRRRPDSVHFFGLTLDFNLWLVSREAKRLGVPLVVHYNGGRPPRSRARRALQLANLESADRLLFSTREHARPWVEAGLLPSLERVTPLMETSSVFERKSRRDARQITGMFGDPVFVWTGRLHPEKDPSTALRGFERILRDRPEARLYLYYLTDELLGDLRSYVRSRPALRERVCFRGRASYEFMPAIYNSADFFLQASAREASGCAVLEAMSCGAIPVVTDIPSFRAMTCGGEFGLLFPLGDDESLARQVQALESHQIAPLSDAVRCHFEKQLSFPSLAMQLQGLYRQLVGSPESADTIA